MAFIDIRLYKWTFWCEILREMRIKPSVYRSLWLLLLLSLPLLSLLLCSLRNSLLNPDASPMLSKKYRCLVEFLDNTIIHRPTSQGNLFRDFTSQPVSKLPNQSSFHHYCTLPPIQRNGEPATDAQHETKVSPDILKIHDGDSSDLLSPRDLQGDSKDEAMTHEVEGVNPSSSPIVKGDINASSVYSVILFIYLKDCFMECLGIFHFLGRQQWSALW